MTICDIFFRGVNIFVMKCDRGGGGEGGSEKVEISVTPLMNEPLWLCVFLICKRIKIGKSVKFVRVAAG